MQRAGFWAAGGFGLAAGSEQVKECQNDGYCSYGCETAVASASAGIVIAWSAATAVAEFVVYVAVAYVSVSVAVPVETVHFRLLS